MNDFEVERRRQVERVSASPNAPQESDLMRWRNGLGALADRISALAQDLGNFGDELFGSEPAAITGKSDRGESHCHVAAMDAQFERLQGAVTTAENLFHRLRRLA